LELRADLRIDAGGRRHHGRRKVRHLSDAAGVFAGDVAFRKVAFPEEIAAVVAFDAAVFSEHPGDAWGADDWASYDCYWMLLGKQRIGCCAFWPDTDFDEVPSPGCLWVVSVGILPSYRGRGLGRAFIEWQIEYARRNGFTKIVVNTRQSNAPMRAVCGRSGFRVREFVRDYYEDPDEPAVVMERTTTGEAA
jgi:GNAT superfamily N-acetyltransferase